MDRKSIATSLATIGLLAGALSFSLASPAHAATKTVKPSVTIWAWYWENAQAHDVAGPTGNVSLDTNNEFCPQVPGGGLGNLTEETCAEGRLPVRIKAGDYEKPNQLGAVTFDTLSTIPIDSEVKSFEATFLEAKSGCQDKDTAPSGKQCEFTDPVNVEGHKLQACLVTQIFGEGAARPYNEVPNHECTNSDPTATRKKVKVGGEERYAWTFDLTEFAQKWADGSNVASSIIITGAEPKDTGPQDSWRVVLDGPVEEDGISVKAVIEPPDDLIPPDPPVPPEDPIGGDDGTWIPGSPGVPGTPGTPGTPAGDSTTPTDPAGAGEDAGAPTGGEGTGTEEPVDATEQPGSELAADQGPPSGGLPGYAWAAMLAGAIGFSLLRRAVFESSSGIRPDGVLAQIQRLNAERRGASAAARLVGQPAPLAALATIGGFVYGTTKVVVKKAIDVVGNLKRS